MAKRTEELIESPERLARPEVQALTPYQSARRIVAAAGGRGDVWLNANESAESDVYALRNGRLNRYPDAQPEQVVERYAAYAGVSPDSILVTRGGDEGIDLLIRTFCTGGRDAILQFPPTYGMYSVSAETANVRVVNLETRPEAGWTPDVSLLEAALEKDPSIQVVFACSPNNPTGNLLSPEVVEGLIEATRGRAILVMDEAYIEFSPDDTAAGRLEGAPHLVLIRTLSKAFALAGIRCGFLIGNPAVIGMLRKVIAPYPIPAPVADIAEQALADEGIARMKSRVEATLRRREALARALEALPGVLRVSPSASNFLLVKFADAKRVFEGLWDRGIILRDQSRQPTLAGSIRITVGTDEENALLIAALEELLGEY